jgi:hypothetical protein
MRSWDVIRRGLQHPACSEEPRFPVGVHGLPWPRDGSCGDRRASLYLGSASRNVVAWQDVADRVSAATRPSPTITSNVSVVT